MAGRVEGKVALITGAARGQGREHAVRLAEEGADIIGFDLCAPVPHRPEIPASSPEDLEETALLVEKFGRRMLPVIGDVKNFGDLQRAVDQGINEFGQIDIAIANAGTCGGNTLTHEISEESWQTTLDVNLTGVWHTAKAVLPTMIESRNGGSIIITASSAGIKPMQQLGDYGATKAAVIYLTKVMAIENGAHRIRVNAVAPGNTDTPLIANESIYRAFRPDLENPTKEDVMDIFSSMGALKTRPWAMPRDIANAVLWLASDEAELVTGSVVSVDMGIAIA